MHCPELLLCGESKGRDLVSCSQGEAVRFSSQGLGRFAQQQEKPASSGRYVRGRGRAGRELLQVLIFAYPPFSPGGFMGIHTFMSVQKHAKRFVDGAKPGSAHPARPSVVLQSPPGGITG